MAKKHYRNAPNEFYLEDTLEDVLYSSPMFTIEEEVGEIVKYKKTRISFQPQHSQIKHD
jgi:hypothetical protein